MKKELKPLTSDEISVVYKVLRENILINDLSKLTSKEWQSMLFGRPDINDEDIVSIMSTAKNCYPKWRKADNYGDHQLELNFHLLHTKYKDYINYDVSTNIATRRMQFRVPEYLITETFKSHNTEIMFGSLPIETLTLINKVFGEFKQHKCGLMSYLKIDEMCIYLHKYIELTDNEIRYVHKYILEPFQRFDAHDMLIYERKVNYNFIGDFNNWITNNYTDEMFNKNFVHLNEDELTVLKMRII